MKLLVCGKNESIREYHNFDVEIIGSCDLKSIKDKVSRFGEVYIRTMDLHESFVELVKKCDIPITTEIYSLAAVLKTMSLVSKMLDIDMKLTWNNELSESFFVLRGKNYEKIQKIDFTEEYSGDECIEKLREKMRMPTVEHKGKKYEISKKCLKGFEIKDYISSGTYGTVHKACFEDDCEYVVKIQSTNKLPDHIEEADRTKEMSNLGIGPKYYGSWACMKDGVFLIITEKWDDRLYAEDLEHLESSIINKYEELINKLHNAGYIHMDLQPKNILVKKDEDGNITDIAITDFGLMVEKSEIEDLNKEWITEMFDYFMTWDITADYFEDNNVELIDVIEDPTHFDKALLYYMREQNKVSK